jgi:hypothetical protein
LNKESRLFFGAFQLLVVDETDDHEEISKGKDRDNESDVRKKILEAIMLANHKHCYIFPAAAILIGSLSEGDVMHAAHFN